MMELIIWLGCSLPLVYYTLIITLKYLSPNPKPPTPESLVYRTGSRPDQKLRLKSIVEESRADLSKQKEDEQQVPTMVELSVIIPAYNEESRLKSGLKDALKWLEERRLSKQTKQTIKSEELKDYEPGSYEILIVDDGSQDQTLKIAIELSIDHHQSIIDLEPNQAEIRVISLGKNRGKGGAVRHGILHARGNRILFADADGASDFSDLTKLINTLNQIQNEITLSSSSIKTTTTNAKREEKNKVYGMTIGSRAHLISSKSVVSRSQFRNFLMKSFHLYLYLLGLRDINDTQCGFKLMTRDTAKILIPNLHVEGWIFDVELLLLAKLIHKPIIPIKEVSIRWSEIEGSKLSIFKDSLIMAIELLIIRLNYWLGVWSIP